MSLPPSYSSLYPPPSPSLPPPPYQRIAHASEQALYPYACCPYGYTTATGVYEYRHPGSYYIPIHTAQVSRAHMMNPQRYDSRYCARQEVQAQAQAPTQCRFQPQARYYPSHYFSSGASCPDENTRFPNLYPYAGFGFACTYPYPLYSNMGYTYNMYLLGNAGPWYWGG